MREHKYRAWHKISKKMDEVTELCTWRHLVYVATEELSWTYNDIELMQYTGLKDKHGTPIYEGDIVGTPDDPNYSGPVRFDNVELSYDDYTVRMNGFYVDTPLESTRLFVTEEMNTGKVSILGNIYETPELLKQ